MFFAACSYRSTRYFKELATELFDRARRSKYDYDAAGRLSQVTGSPYGGISRYATGMQYRAFGALKEATYENGLKLSNGYNARLQLAQMQVGIPNAQNGRSEY